MDEEQLLKTLAAAARREPPPVVDVSGPVLRRIRSFREGVDPPMAWAAGLAALAATIVLAYTASVWSGWQDPMTSMLVSMVPVLQ